MKKLNILITLLMLLFTSSLFAQAKQVEEDALFSSQKIKTNLQAGKTYNVSVTFQNTSKKTWTKGEYWILHSDPRMSATINNIWGINEIKIKKNVKPGKTYKFNFTITAPNEPGTYFFSWMMCTNSGTFGQGSEMKEITVTK